MCNTFQKCQAIIRNNKSTFGRPRFAATKSKIRQGNSSSSSVQFHSSSCCKCFCVLCVCALVACICMCVCVCVDGWCIAVRLFLNTCWGCCWAAACFFNASRRTGRNSFRSDFGLGCWLDGIQIGGCVPEEIDDGCCCCSCRCWWLLSLSGGLCCWPGDQTPDFRHILERERERKQRWSFSVANEL